ncbi:hypothetical protein C8F01DRAFT_966883, partial [Mycena amicta]
KRLEDAISIVGTCMDMCPRFERYRRKRGNNLFEWETVRFIPLRRLGDKTISSDLRLPLVLKVRCRPACPPGSLVLTQSRKPSTTYLFYDLIPRGGFSPTFNFIRDRSRAVRTDFTMQHDTDPLAMECHERCARFHIMEQDHGGFSIALEEQQLMKDVVS